MSSVDAEAALREAIEADPDDETARMVYADWLIERGDPRGELIQIQAARRADPWWANIRLAHREQRLLKAFQQPRSKTRTLFDRGEEGWDFEVGEHANLPPRRWLRPRDVYPARSGPFLASAPFANVRRLDLREWSDWTAALASAARPRRVLLPTRAGVFVEALREAPLFERVEHLELHASCDDAQLARLVTAPWAANLEQLSLASLGDTGTSSLGVTDRGIEAIAKARLPKLRRLDLRYARITTRGIEALAASASPLEAVMIDADGLGAEGFAALHRSRLASITHASIRGWWSSLDSIVALVRSPTWGGELELRVMLPTATENVIEREMAVLDTLATLTETRPLRALGASYPLPPFFESAFARSLEHLTTLSSVELGESALRLRSLCTHSITRATLAAPALANLERLSLGHVTFDAVIALAGSTLRPVDLEIRGPGSTAGTAELVRSPVLERVVDLTLALEGNLGSKYVTKALLETPYLQQVQRLELDFLTTFPIPQRVEIEARFGAAVYPRFERS